MLCTLVSPEQAESRIYDIEPVSPYLEAKDNTPYNREIDQSCLTRYQATLILGLRPPHWPLWAVTRLHV